ALGGRARVAGRRSRWLARVAQLHRRSTRRRSQPVADVRRPLGNGARFPWPLRSALAADRRRVEELLSQWDAGVAPTPKSYRAPALAPRGFRRRSGIPAAGTSRSGSERGAAHFDIDGASIQ